MAEILRTEGHYTVVRKGYSTYVIGESGEWQKVWPRDIDSLIRLAEANGGLDFPEDADLVPIGIAAKGQAWITAYLRVVHRLWNDDAAEKLGVKSSSVRQVMSDFRKNRR